MPIIHLLGTIIAKIFKHRHKWQVRGVNRYGSPTYKICLKCRKTCARVNQPFTKEVWQECTPNVELDSQFDNQDRYIFKT